MQQERIEQLEVQVSELHRRVRELEKRERRAVPTAPKPIASPSRVEAPPGPKTIQPAPMPVWGNVSLTSVAERLGAPDRESMEDMLGGRVLAWVGGVAVVLGVAFFLVMAASRGWIDEATRTLLALFGSTALLCAALYLHERMGRTQAALAAASTAVAALYVTLVAATQLYDLVDPRLGLLFAGLVGATATVLAVRWAEPVVAGIGIVGALLAPVLVDSGTDGVALAFVVVALVAAVGVLLWQRWSWLGAVSFLVTAPQLLAWLGERNALGLELATLAVAWVLFVAAAIGYELRVPTTKLRLASARRSSS